MGDEIHDRQKTQRDIQKSPEFVDVFSKIVSGKPNYKSVVDLRPVMVKCLKCGKSVSDKQKFCPECGTKVWLKPTKCPKCMKSVQEDDKFCQDCGTSLMPPSA